jgi:ADP-ribosylglycohydrolase
MATLKACLRLCCGVPPERSGIFSAGNGPAMRSAILGVCCDGDINRLRDWVRISTRISHTDPKAEAGAFAVALAAYFSAKGESADREKFISVLALSGSDTTAYQELVGLIRRASRSAEAGESAEQYAISMGMEKGISGYMFHTVPVVIQVWFKGEDYRTAVSDIIRCGGDTDSTAAILGGIIGAHGRSEVPSEWVGRLSDWPRSVRWMEALSHRLADAIQSQEPGPRLTLSFPLTLIRNLFFFGVIMVHVVRRMLPPY